MKYFIAQQGWHLGLIVFSYLQKIFNMFLRILFGLLTKPSLGPLVSRLITTLASFTLQKITIFVCNFIYKHVMRNKESPCE